MREFRLLLLASAVLIAVVHAGCSSKGIGIKIDGIPDSARMGFAKGVAGREIDQIAIAIVSSKIVCQQVCGSVEQCAVCQHEDASGVCRLFAEYEEGAPIVVGGPPKPVTTYVKFFSRVAIEKVEEISVEDRAEFLRKVFQDQRPVEIVEVCRRPTIEDLYTTPISATDKTSMTESGWSYSSDAGDTSETDSGTGEVTPTISKDGTESHEDTKGTGEVTSPAISTDKQGSNGYTKSETESSGTGEVTISSDGFTQQQNGLGGSTDASTRGSTPLSESEHTDSDHDSRSPITEPSPAETVSSQSATPDASPQIDSTLVQSSSPVSMATTGSFSTTETKGIQPEPSTIKNDGITNKSISPDAATQSEQTEAMTLSTVSSSETDSSHGTATNSLFGSTSSDSHTLAPSPSTASIAPTLKEDDASTRFSSTSVDVDTTAETTASTKGQSDQDTPSTEDNAEQTTDNGGGISSTSDGAQQNNDGSTDVLTSTHSFPTPSSVTTLSQSTASDGDESISSPSHTVKVKEDNEGSTSPPNDGVKSTINQLDEMDSSSSSTVGKTDDAETKTASSSSTQENSSLSPTTSEASSSTVVTSTSLESTIQSTPSSSISSSTSPYTSSPDHVTSPSTSASSSPVPSTTPTTVTTAKPVKAGMIAFDSNRFLVYSRQPFDLPAVAKSARVLQVNSFIGCVIQISLPDGSVITKRNGENDGVNIKGVTGVWATCQ